MSSVDLSYEQVDNLINEISMGGKLVEVKTSVGKPILLFVSHGTVFDRMISNREYAKSYAQAIKDGFLTEEQTREVMRSRGIFSDEDEAQLEKYYNQLKGQKLLLEKITRAPARKDRVRNAIDILNKQIDELLLKREKGLEYSAERKAQESKYLYLTWRGVLDPDTKERYWNTLYDFNEERDILFRQSVFVEIIKLGVGLDVSIMRFIARHSLWRIRYTTSLKTGISLFSCSLPEYTVDQLALAYWSQFYQSVYEMLPSDKPDDSIIEDDAALDAFMSSYMEEKEKETQDAKMGKTGGTKSALDHGEVIVTRSNPLYNDMEYTGKTKNTASNDLKEINRESQNNRNNIRKRRRKLREHLN